jgi:hypothetical protein
MRAKLFAALVGGALMLAIGSPAAIAETFTCPQPQQINCVPAVKTVDGWRSNGSQTTGNSFGPNDQCANVIKMSANKQRLLCCYVKCGVFIRDVKATSCTKVSESEFNCQ